MVIWDASDLPARPNSGIGWAELKQFLTAPLETLRLRGAGPHADSEAIDAVPLQEPIRRRIVLPPPFTIPPIWA